MACKKSELISAINSFGSARAVNDKNLLDFSVELLNNLLDTIEFEAELPKENTETEVVN